MDKIDPNPRTALSTLPVRLHSATAKRAAGNAGLMFFLLRMAFWLSVVLVLLPSGATQRGPSTSDVGASAAVSAASATVHDLEGFCAREPDACTVGSHLATTMGYRARAGAKMLYDFLSEALAQRETGSLGRDPNRSAVQRSSQNTLTPADLAPAWHGPAPKAAKPSA
jgi:hypothetical protein